LNGLVSLGLVVTGGERYTLAPEIRELFGPDPARNVKYNVFGFRRENEVWPPAAELREA
jgi:hypothetical protein